mgnify:CR=1 FL=1
MTEHKFLQAIRANPTDADTRAIYADWLEERGDRRATFVRAHLERWSISGRHRARRLQRQLAELERGLDRRWLAAVAPERKRNPYLKSVDIAVRGMKNRVLYIPDASTQTIAEIPYGLLFVMAWWSGPSQLSLRSLRETLCELDPLGFLTLVIGDIDQIAHADIPKMFGENVLHGCGETVWVEEGEAVSIACRGIPTPTTMRENTRKLVASLAERFCVQAAPDPTTSRLCM